MHGIDGGLLAVEIAASVHRQNKSKKEKAPNEDKEGGMEEISGMSEEVVCKRSGESFFVPKLSEMVTKKPVTSRADAVQWWRPDNWAKLGGALQMDHCLGGYEEVASNVSISTLSGYHTM